MKVRELRALVNGIPVECDDLSVSVCWQGRQNQLRLKNGNANVSAKQCTVCKRTFISPYTTRQQRWCSFRCEAEGERKRNSARAFRNMLKRAAIRAAQQLEANHEHQDAAE